MRATSNAALARRLGGSGALLLALVTAAAASAAPAPPPPGATEVKVERLRPVHEKYATLRFLKANRDFIRAREDRLGEKVMETRLPAESIDPRFLAYREMLARIAAGRDSVARLDDARQREQLMASVTALGTLEGRLDLLERQLADQRERLAVLEKDFTGDQRTALLVVLSGYPGSAGVDRVAIGMESGDTLSVDISAEQRESLRRGGVIEVFHRLVEPRDQVVTVSLAGDAWPAGDAGFLELDPARDRLTVLRLDLSTLEVRQGAPGIRASAWLHGAGTPAIGS